MNTNEPSLKNLKLFVPTYNYTVFPEEVARGELDEFSEPTTPVLVHESEGVFVGLGTHAFHDSNKPDIQIERQPNGWMIFLHPVGGSDASGYLYFLDSGESYLKKERSWGPTPAIQILEPHEDWPFLGQPVPSPKEL